MRELEKAFAQCRERGDFRLVHYSIQADHAHLIVEAQDRDALGRGMRSLAARFARTANRVFGRSGPVLADRYHLRVLRTPREVRSALAYVVLNHRRHAAQRAPRALRGTVRIDPASSGRWFDGWRHGVAAREADGDAAVAAPRFWLLRIGWRRHGLIDPAEIPGSCRCTARWKDVNSR